MLKWQIFTLSLAQCFLISACETEDPFYLIGKAPIASCQIKSINGVPYQKGMKIEPLDHIILDASGSKPTADKATITGYFWEKIKEPKGSTAQLSSPGGPETGFIFSNNINGLDLAGRYEVKLTVIDSFGSQSNNSCTITLDAIPSALLHIQLVWDTEYGDMDLHLAKKNNQDQFCVSSLNEEASPGPLGNLCPIEEYAECNYTNCRDYHENARPNWDLNTTLNSKGDPSLDIDDLSGFGPENINIEHASGGEFLISVHHYAGGRPSGNTVRVYLYGQLYAEFYRILKPNAWWEVALVEWPSDISAYPCLVDLATQKKACINPATLIAGDLKQSSVAGCQTDLDCGPNTSCSPETHQCYSILNLCQTDEECPIEKRCIIKTNTCIIPECENDRQCKVQNHQSKCNLLTFKCYLPP